MIYDADFYHICVPEYFLALEICRDINLYTSQKPLVLTLGMFDGVHLGHKKILERLREISLERGFESAIFTFSLHPRRSLDPDFKIELLTTLDEKLKLFSGNDIDRVFINDFTDEFRELSAEDFVKKILVDRLNTKHLIIGYDHAFGKNRQGDFEFLKQMSLRYNFMVEQIQPREVDSTLISSTKIRKAISEGNVSLANKMLGYKYSFSGEVIRGKQLGRSIGFPTANIKVNSDKLLPKIGAYIVEVNVSGEKYFGMLNIGKRPTINAEGVQVEVYILDFDQNIYGSEVEIKFLEFLREEEKFPNLEALKNQLQKDKKMVREYVMNNQNKVY